mmetsp:Transcript_2166/g.7843  ORF Transcript_2166/g.7843 Transcript_2166/m.7843 type:complete len:242 (+) Transcript_2166:1428-2153(+)
MSVGRRRRGARLFAQACDAPLLLERLPGPLRAVGARRLRHQEELQLAGDDAPARRVESARVRHAARDGQPVVEVRVRLEPRLRQVLLVPCGRGAAGSAAGRRPVAQGAVVAVAQKDRRRLEIAARCGGVAHGCRRPPPVLLHVIEHRDDRCAHAFRLCHRIRRRRQRALLRQDARLELEERRDDAEGSRPRQERTLKAFQLAQDLFKIYPTLQSALPCRKRTQAQRTVVEKGSASPLYDVV